MNRALKLLALLLIGAVFGVPAALSTFDHSSRHVVIGAHNATVEPTFDGYATLDFGPVLPRMRVPSQQRFGLGVSIDFGDSEVSNLDELAARDAVIASQPQGEIAKVTATVVDMAGEAALRGVGVAITAIGAAVLAWRAVGAERRAVLLARAKEPTSGGLLATMAAVGVALLAVALVAVPERPRADVTGQTWTALRTAIPNIPSDPVLDSVEVSQGAASRGGGALIEGAIKTYRASVEFYGKMADEARTVVVRRPGPGETTAVVVTDRHDNIGMDKVARAIADQAGATMLFDLGDDTSSGGKWEEFSINSLAREFKGFDVVAIAGNHDTGPSIRRTMRAAGFRVLAGKTETIDGISFLGASDPRSSGLTAGYSGDESDSIASIRALDAALTKAACADGGVSVLLSHSPAAVKQAAASGCADLVLTGHLHRQVGPAVVAGSNGRSTVTLTTGSTGGAVYAFALGSKLRRPAQMTIVTFKDGRPAGLQLIDFNPGGAVSAQPYRPITVSPRP